MESFGRGRGRCLNLVNYLRSFPQRSHPLKRKSENKRRKEAAVDGNMCAHRKTIRFSQPTGKQVYNKMSRDRKHSQEDSFAFPSKFEKTNGAKKSETFIIC